MAGRCLGVRLWNHTGWWPADRRSLCSVCLDGLGSDQGNPKSFEDMPGPRGLPYLGTLLRYRLGPYSKEDYPRALSDGRRVYGPVFRETMAGRTIVHVFCPDMVRHVYETEGTSPYIPPLLPVSKLHRTKRSMSPGLGNVNGRDWERLRQAVQASFLRPSKALAYVPLADKVARDFVEFIDKKRGGATGLIGDFYREASKWNLESTAYTVLERRLGAMVSDAPSDAETIIDGMATTYRWSTKLRFALPLHKLFRTPAWMAIVKSEDLVFGTAQRIMDSAVEEMRRKAEAGQLQPNEFRFLRDMLSKPSLSYKDVSILTLTFCTDALVTTVPTLVYFLYCLATNPEKQEILYREVTSVLPDSDNPIDGAVLNKMPYMKTCLKETFRLFPVAPEVTRITTQEIRLGGYCIPADVDLYLHSNMVLRDPTYFSDPDVFVPERWTRGVSQRDYHPYLVTPFSHGPRMCAGRRFVEQDLYVVVARILERFRLTWHSEKPLGQRFNILYTPDRPAQIGFEPRI